jgi:hypothetical protein
LIEVSNESVTLYEGRLKQGQQFIEDFCCLLDLLDERSAIHIVMLLPLEPLVLFVSY